MTGMFLRDRRRWLPVLLLISLSACAPARVVDTSDAVPDTTVGGERATPGSYRVLTQDRESFVPRVRMYDILHTELDLDFDFQSEVLHGTATHTLTPLASGTDSLLFDAVAMDIHSVTLTHAGWTDTLVTRHIDGRLVALPVEPLRAIDTVRVRIAYSAYPERSEEVRGLHFVDGPGDDPARPTQVWTLSQPEDARFWFPTWDYPDDFMSFTVHLTVPDELATYANGDLTEQQRRDGDRRDTWEFPERHVPYLAAFAVGRFASIRDTYMRADSTTVPLEYIVEPAFAGEAAAIFEETRPMLEVFERRTGLRYPWSNYKQVVVREFTAGGMEHTTMSTLSSRVLRDERARLDGSARGLIAHELAHQWFGNLMTSADWANLALNEGFAQYFEEVYLEDAVGTDEAQEKAIRDLRSYLDEAESIRRPIIWYGYEDPYELYDRHTYAKAARVLNQLRFELGEEAWWEGVRSYVRDNRHRNVTADDLQHTMEAASGRDLSLFFEQWFHAPGHPELLVEHRIDEAQGLYEIRVRQKQDTTRTPVFTFDVDFEVRYRHRRPFCGRVTVASADTTFQIGTAGEIDYVRFDAGTELLADIQTQKPLREWVAQAMRSPEMAARYEAVGVLAAQDPSQIIRDALVLSLRDTYDLVRLRAVEAVAGVVDVDVGVRRTLVELAAEDKSARVRAAAVRTLGAASVDDDLVAATLLDALSDSSYAVTAAAVRAVAQHQPAEALDAFEPLLTMESWSATVERALTSALPQIALDDRIGRFISFHSRAERPADVRMLVARLLGELPPGAPARDLRTESLRSLLSDRDERVRLTAARALISGEYEIDARFISSRIAVESSPRVQALLEQYVAAPAGGAR